jgi:hypothetical protein
LSESRAGEDLIDKYAHGEEGDASEIRPGGGESRRGSVRCTSRRRRDADYISGAGLLVVAAKAQLALSAVLRRELADEPFRVNEVRISRRIERAHRPGVIPARVAGAALLKAITISVTGRLLRYDGSQLMLEDE